MSQIASAKLFGKDSWVQWCFRRFSEGRCKNHLSWCTRITSTPSEHVQVCSVVRLLSNNLRYLTTSNTQVAGRKEHKDQSVERRFSEHPKNTIMATELLDRKKYKIACHSFVKTTKEYKHKCSRKLFCEQFRPA